ncbi:MAG: DUF2130 domain-containing protein [Candidatus Dojkabacteria bacterium]
MSDLNYITCPKCGHRVPINEALSHQVEEKYKVEYELKLKEIDDERQKIETLKVESESRIQKALEEREQELLEKSRRHLQEQQQKLREQLEQEARERLTVEFEDLMRQNEEKEKQLREARDLELSLREERRKLEEKEKNFEMEMIRKMDEERKKIEANIEAQTSDKYRMKELEHVKQVQDLQKALEEAQRKAAGGSVQVRGEVQELDLEALLKTNFIYDEIKEVPKGITGADVMQIVRDEFGQTCGMILWESKHTKSFSEKWLTKLKDDLVKAKGKIAVLVTETLPEDITTFGFRNGVWVTGFESVLELTLVLRMNLIELKRFEKLNEGREEKMNFVYKYLSSDDFRNKIVSVVETFKMMQDQLDQEKRAFQKQWSTREMQIRRMTEGTVSIIGDLQGIMGGAMPRIEGVDMPGLLGDGGVDGLGLD